jgi:hypothetical protein
MELQLHTTIAPQQAYKPIVRAAVQHLLVTFNADEWGTARILFLDEDNNALRAEDVVITLAESTNWKKDDTYILNLALNKLGLSMATEG